MGYYIDPTNVSKEIWLAGNAKPCTDAQASRSDFNETFPVVLVDNGFFTAAGICPDKEELKAFTLPDDHRPKKFFLVDRTKLVEVCPAFARLLLRKEQA